MGSYNLINITMIIKILSALFVAACDLLLTIEAFILLCKSIIDSRNVLLLIGVLVALCWLLPTSKKRAKKLSDEASYALGLGED